MEWNGMEWNVQLYGRMRADLLQVWFDWKGMQWNVMECDVM